MLDDEITEVFEWGALNAAIDSNAYKQAIPFPHIVIDNAFDHLALDNVLKAWPSMSENVEEHNDGLYVKKKFGTTHETQLSAHIRLFLNQLSTPKFLIYLEKLTGIGALLPDPYNFGGGLHQTEVGGRLAIHADYNKHPKFKLDRRLNVLIYLNKKWDEAMGGELELWNNTMDQCDKKILPLFNRTVIFSTTAISYHGQPNPVACPQNESRKSIALYYYSNGRPEESMSFGLEQSTVWKRRPVVGY